MIGVSSEYNFAFEDLSKMKMAASSDICEFEFVPAYTATTCEIVNSLAPTVYRNVQSPDVVRFSPNEQVVAKVKELMGNTTLYRIPRSYDPNAGYYEIPCTQCVRFFEAIVLLQGEGKTVALSRDVFQKTIEQLTEKNYLTKEQAQSLEEKTGFSFVLDRYESQVRQSKNADGALSLAYYYRKKEGSSYDETLYWLTKAKDYLQGKKIGEVLDLKTFFTPCKTIYRAGFFVTSGSDDELIKAASRSPIQEVSLSPFVDYSFAMATNIGAFLAQSTSVHTVNLSSAWIHSGDRLSAQTIGPIAEALKSNTSIRNLDLSDTRIGDKGVKKIICAFKLNPLSPVESLNFFCCGLTDDGAEKLRDFVKANASITWVNIAYNSVNKALTDEISAILEERNSKESEPDPKKQKVE